MYPYVWQAFRTTHAEQDVELMIINGNACQFLATKARTFLQGTASMKKTKSMC